jgi:pyruvate/2-oxoglutarate dehydrogenase complex dihydrolipoamide acyltransferase (E2) component
VALLVHKNGLESQLGNIKGTGPKGRILKGDIILWLENGSKNASAKTPAWSGPKSVGFHSVGFDYFPQVSLQKDKTFPIEEEADLFRYLAGASSRKAHNEPPIKQSDMDLIEYLK